MPGRIVLIDHHDNPGDDRATVYLQAMGFDIDLRLPVNGDELPVPDRSIAGAVIYGGAHNVTEIEKFPFLEAEIQWIKKAISTGLPLVGICLGAQLIAHALGAKIGYHSAGRCEFGYYKIRPGDSAEHWIGQDMLVTQAHCQQFALPPGAVLLATGDEFPNQAFRYGDHVFGLQFHPEVTPAIFQRWQNSDWALFHRPGAQTKAQQDRLMDAADDIQGPWFHNFLEKVFDRSADKTL